MIELQEPSHHIAQGINIFRWPWNPKSYPCQISELGCTSRMCRRPPTLSKTPRVPNDPAKIHVRPLKSQECVTYTLRKTCFWFSLHLWWWANGRNPLKPNHPSTFSTVVVVVKTLILRRHVLELYFLSQYLSLAKPVGWHLMRFFCWPAARAFATSGSLLQRALWTMLMVNFCSFSPSSNAPWSFPLEVTLWPVHRWWWIISGVTA